MDRFGALNRQWLNKMEEYNWPYNNKQPKQGIVQLLTTSSNVSSTTSTESTISSTNSTELATESAPIHICLRKTTIPRNFNMSSAAPPHQGRIYKVNLWNDGTYCKLRETMVSWCTFHNYFAFEVLITINAHVVFLMNGNHWASSIQRDFPCIQEQFSWIRQKKLILLFGSAQEVIRKQKILQAIIRTLFY